MLSSKQALYKALDILSVIQALYELLDILSVIQGDLQDQAFWNLLA